MIKRLNSYEETAIEKVLKGFGFHLVGGSTEITDDETMFLHVTIDRGCAGSSNNQRLGRMLKNALDVDQVYDEGIRIA